jgi:ketosteroid isomerase-like protein
MTRRLPIWANRWEEPMSPGVGRRIALLAVPLVALAGPARAEVPAEFRRLLETYAKALDGNDVETLVGLFSPNGVLMAEGMPAAAGHDALRAAYRRIFATLKVALRFDLLDGEQSGDLGWVRATSAGRTRVLATGAESEGTFHLLIVFRRDGGAWKIRDYIYTSSGAK